MCTADVCNTIVNLCNLPPIDRNERSALTDVCNGLEMLAALRRIKPIELATTPKEHLGSCDPRRSCHTVGR